MSANEKQRDPHARKNTTRKEWVLQRKFHVRISFEVY